MSFTTYARDVCLDRASDTNNPRHGVFIQASLAKGGDPGWQASEKRLDDNISNDDGWLHYTGSGRGGFSTYLKRVWLLDSHILVAELPKISGGYHITAMDLNLCLANDNGNFLWTAGGGLLDNKPKAWKFDESTLGSHTQNPVKGS